MKKIKNNLNFNISYRSLDKQLFEQLFRDYFTRLCNFAQNYISDLDTTREIVQEVYINLWQKKESIDTDKSIKSYLYASVKNRCLNYIRDNKKFRSYVLDVELADFEVTFESDAFTESELQTKINNALGKLPEKCRKVFLLSRFEELKYKEIADELNISVKTVEAQMSKALKILREELKDYMIIILLMMI